MRTKHWMKRCWPCWRSIEVCLARRVGATHHCEALEHGGLHPPYVEVSATHRVSLRSAPSCQPSLVWGAGPRIPARAFSAARHALQRMPIAPPFTPRYAEVNSIGTCRYSSASDAEKCPRRCGAAGRSLRQCFTAIARDFLGDVRQKRWLVAPVTGFGRQRAR